MLSRWLDDYRRHRELRALFDEFGRRAGLAAWARIHTIVRGSQYGYGPAVYLGPDPFRQR